MAPAIRRDFGSSVENHEFRMRAADRIYGYFHHGGLLTSESVRKRFQTRAKEIESAVICESARWGDTAEYRRRPGQVPLNRDDHWRPEINRILSNYIPERSDIVLGQLFRHGLLPDFEPPRFNQFGGTVPKGYRLTLQAPKGGIYHTADGSDPRLVGGRISGTAWKFEEEVIIDRPITVKTRVLLAGEWSALAEATFVPDAVPSKP